MNGTRVSRRTFLAGAGATAAASTTAKSYGRILGANERILAGVIGSGGRGRKLMDMFQKFGGQCVAVCDVYEKNRATGARLAGGEAKSFSDHRKLLETKNMDAVLVGSPDHWHHDHLVDSVSAGRDVYVEKPMSHSVAQGAAMVRAVRASKQVVQVGMQRRSSEAVQWAKEVIDKGVLGEVNAVKAEWNWNMPPLRSRTLEGSLDWERFCGPAGKQPLAMGDYKNVPFFHWRYWWAFSGGNCTDQGTHLMDVVQWFVNDSRPPRSAICHGDVFRLQPSETPDAFCAVFEYPGFIATWTLVYTNAYKNGWRILFQGNKGTLILDNQGFRVYPESGERVGSSDEPSIQYRTSIPSEPHMANFMECVKSRQEPNAPVEIGHAAVTGPHLANMALRQKTRARLSEDGSEVITHSGA